MAWSNDLSSVVWSIIGKTAETLPPILSPVPVDVSEMKGRKSIQATNWVFCCAARPMAFFTCAPGSG